MYFLRNREFLNFYCCFISVLIPSYFKALDKHFHCFKRLALLLINELPMTWIIILSHVIQCKSWRWHHVTMTYRPFLQWSKSSNGELGYYLDGRPFDCSFICSRINTVGYGMGRKSSLGAYVDSLKVKGTFQVFWDFFATSIRTILLSKRK